MAGGFSLANRFFCTSGTLRPKICIVGGGPAGFYAAQHLIKKLKNSDIDIMEKLPVPFGLVRFGVAPDHPEVKNVINTFTKTAQHPQIRFIGNVALGKDVSLEQLRKFYHIVLLTYGAEENRKLNIPGEDLGNVISARNIVGWYNGVPENVNLDINLSGESVAIFGQGNVAVDVARILLSPIDELKKTDITEYSLQKISHSKIKKVYLVGRRGPLQAAYTIKELREMLKLRDCHSVWRPDDFSLITNKLVETLARPKKRIMELMLKSVQEQKVLEEKAAKIFNPVFLRSPLKFTGENGVKEVVLGVNKLVGDDLLKQSAVLTDAREQLQCDLAVTSIGYKSVQVDPAIPFDEKNGIAQNVNGKISSGLYTTGWLGTGPVGVILTTMSNAFGVAELIIKDIEGGLTEIKPGFEQLNQLLKEKNIPVVDWSGWEKIDKYEVEQGKTHGKPREKLVDVNKMLEIAC